MQSLGYEFGAGIAFGAGIVCLIWGVTRLSSQTPLESPHTNRHVEDGSKLEQLDSSSVNHREPIEAALDLELDESVPVVDLLVRPVGAILTLCRTLTKLEPRGYVLIDDVTAVLAECVGVDSVRPNVVVRIKER
jgi:hypothetical protein